MRRVLVVEDEYLVACALEIALLDAGFAVVGPANSLQAAWRLALSEPFDAAVLDVNLRGETVYPLAEELAERGVPLLLATGYGDAAIPERFAATPRLRKPFDANALTQALDRIS